MDAASQTPKDGAVTELRELTCSRKSSNATTCELSSLELGCTWVQCSATFSATFALELCCVQDWTELEPGPLSEDMNCSNDMGAPDAGRRAAALAGIPEDGAASGDHSVEDLALADAELAETEEDADTTEMPSPSAGSASAPRPLASCFWHPSRCIRSCAGGVLPPSRLLRREEPMLPVERRVNLSVPAQSCGRNVHSCRLSSSRLRSSNDALSRRFSSHCWIAPTPRVSACAFCVISGRPVWSLMTRSAFACLTFSMFLARCVTRRS